MGPPWPSDILIRLSQRRDRFDPASRLWVYTTYLIEVPALMQNLDSEDGDMESFLTFCSKLKYYYEVLTFSLF